MIREWRKTIVAVVGLSVLAATVQADMMPASCVDSGYRQAVAVCDQATLPPASLSTSFDCLNLGLIDLHSLPVRPLPISNADAERTRDANPVQILTDDGQNSLSLCLYGLLGLGLCRSVPLVKKLHFGCIPDWYHHAGPFQIGHSHVIGPDCLSPMTVACFVQPDSMGQDFMPQSYWGTITSLLCTTLFTPNVLASRPPPSLTYESSIV